MTLKLAALAALLALGTAVACQDISSLLPPSYRPRAARSLESIDRNAKAVEARRALAWSAEAAAEAEAVRAYALIAAARSSKEPWASPDGAARSAEAPASCAKARSLAKAAAQSLAAGDEGSAPYVKARDEAAKALSELIRAADLGPKSAAALARRLSARWRGNLVFPETEEIIEILIKAGPAGAREAAISAARGSAEGIALSLIASKEKLMRISPETEAPLKRLEIGSRAYQAWMSAFAAATFPGDAASAQAIDPAGASAGIAAAAALGSGRIAALFDALDRGDGREAAAAHAGRVLAEAWGRSSEQRRRSLAAVYGISESLLAQFCLSLASGAAPAAERPAVDLASCVRSLNILESKFAQEGASGSKPSAIEPALLLLERPELAAIAEGESRYAPLFAEAMKRIEAIYEKAGEDAAARLEASQPLASAAAKALGAGAASLKVRAVKLRPGKEEARRKLAFVATATDASGSSLDLPVDQANAGKAYAWAFARASGLDYSRLDPASLLEKYGQGVVAVYDPEGSDDRLSSGAFPAAAGASSLGPVELELALLGGWRP